MGGRSIFAMTLALAGALVFALGIEVWSWFHLRDAGRDPVFPFGEKLFLHGKPPERYRGHAHRMMAIGVTILLIAFPALLLARV